MNPLTLLDAFRKGKELSHVETWKKIEFTTLAVASIIKTIVFFLPLVGIDLGIDVTDDMIAHTADGVANFLFVAAAIMMPATTKKVGLLPAIKTKKIEGD